MQPQLLCQRRLLQSAALPAEAGRALLLMLLAALRRAVGQREGSCWSVVSAPACCWVDDHQKQESLALLQVGRRHLPAQQQPDSVLHVLAARKPRSAALTALLQLLFQL